MAVVSIFISGTNKVYIFVLKRWIEQSLLVYKHYVEIQKYKNAHTSHRVKLLKTTMPKVTLIRKSNSEIFAKISWIQLVGKLFYLFCCILLF